MCTCACHVLQALGNDLQVTKSGVEEFLPAATVMVVSVTASTTQGSVYWYLDILLGCRYVILDKKWSKMS